MNPEICSVLDTKLAKTRDLASKDSYQEFLFLHASRFYLYLH